MRTSHKASVPAKTPPKKCRHFACRKRLSHKQALCDDFHDSPRVVSQYRIRDILTH